MNRMLAFWVAILFCMAGITIIWTGWKISHTDQAHSEAVPDPDALLADAARIPAGKDEPLLKRYTLTDRNGRAFASEQLGGKVHVTSFFFSNCPHACLLQNKKIKTLQDEFGPKGVVFVSITCDPENDTPERLHEYADLLGADASQWKFLTGDMLYSRRIGAEIYQVHVDKQTHTEKLIVSDRSGKIRGHFGWQDVNEFAEMRKTLKTLLAEKPISASEVSSSDAPVAPETDGSEADTLTDQPESEGE